LQRGSAVAPAPNQHVEDLTLVIDGTPCLADRGAGGRGWASGSFAEAHRRYARAINAKFHWTGHLFQGRFGAVVMDEPHLQRYEISCFHRDVILPSPQSSLSRRRADAIRLIRGVCRGVCWRNSFVRLASLMIRLSTGDRQDGGLHPPYAC
jgi:hypothetical protein